MNITIRVNGVSFFPTFDGITKQLKRVFRLCVCSYLTNMANNMRLLKIHTV